MFNNVKFMICLNCMVLFTIASDSKEFFENTLRQPITEYFSKDDLDNCFRNNYSEQELDFIKINELFYKRYSSKDGFALCKQDIEFCKSTDDDKLLNLIVAQLERHHYFYWIKPLKKEIKKVLSGAH